jgi:hypothetical protein
MAAPVHASSRRGRSVTSYLFKTQVSGTPLHGPRPTDFSLALLDEYYRVLGREEMDLVYRGEVRPKSFISVVNAR